MVRYITTILFIILSLLGFPFVAEVDDLIQEYILQDQLEIIKELRNLAEEHNFLN